MKFGVALWANRNVRELAELAHAAELAGFDELWWPDHYYARELASVLTVSALHTSEIRVGTAVTSPLLRHPAILASLFTTLAELAGDRIVAGFGPGGFEVKTQLRVGARSPLRVMRDAVEVFRSLSAGAQTTVTEDRSWELSEARLATEAHAVPVYLAGRGARMIELAGEIADGVITHGLGESYLDLVRERVEAGASRAWRAPSSIDIALMCEVCLDDDVDKARDELRPRCLYMAGGEYAENLVPLYGLEPGAVSRLREAVRARDSGAPGLVSDAMVDAFAIAGPPQRLADELQRLRDLGIESVILSPGDRVGPDEIAELGKALQGSR